MGLPWRAFSIASAVAAYLVTSTTQTSSWGGGIATFCLSWALLFFGWAIYRVIVYPKFLSPLRHLPEPPNNSFWNGNYAKIYGQPSGAPQREWVNTIPNNGLIRYLGLVNHERIVVTSPKALSEVLTTRNYDWVKPPQFQFFLGRILGNGLLAAEGDVHKLQRKNLMPAFAFRHIKDLYSLFWSKSRESVQAMTRQIRLEGVGGIQEQAKEKTGSAPAAVLDIGEWASRATLDIIGVAGLGHDFGAIENPNNELTQVYQSLIKPNKQALILGILSFFLPNFITTNIPLQRNKDIWDARAYVRTVCHGLIRKKKEKLARKELTDVDILSVALESGHFTDENLADHLMTFLLAGHETTATALLWGIYMMCVHQDVQTKLRDEIRSHLPPISSEDSTISSLDIDHLPYLNAVCSEIFRYWSPVPATFREAAVDTSIQGVHIPKGTRVALVPWAINHSVELWGPDAGRFDPERWMPRFDGDTSAAGGGATSNYAYMTFLHGPRSCIGSGFAKAEFACLLAAWVGTFAFALRDEEDADESKLVIKGGVTAKPVKGMHVRATPLEGW